MIKTKRLTHVIIITTCLFLVLIVASFFWLNKEKTEKIYLLSKPSALNPLIKQAAKADFVLLGESSHGTAEYYNWRATISKELISQHGFSFIVVEGDWDDLYQINLYVKHLISPDGGAQEILQNFKRWPTWMWANKEFLVFVEWLREYNATLDLEKRVGIYGKDIYGAHNSMLAIISYLEVEDESLAREIKNNYACLLSYNNNFSFYVEDILYKNKTCQAEVNTALIKLENWPKKFLFYSQEENKNYFNAIQNAWVVIHAEEHYRKNLNNDETGWNARSLGMTNIFNRLIQRDLKQKKAIVWAHNTHVGDARFTEMNNYGAVNIGQSLRELYGPERIYIVGFGTYEGEVLAGSSWGNPGQIFIIPPARNESLENFLTNYSNSDFMILLNKGWEKTRLKDPIGHRAKGVVYNPLNDAASYVITDVLNRYDAFIFLRETTALKPILPY